MELKDWVEGKFEETETDYKIAGQNILYKNEEGFLKKGVELLCDKLNPTSVLEIGFGMGWTATEFQDQGVQRHVILEPNKENYQMALEWKEQFNTDIEILNIFSWDFETSEVFDLVYDDQVPFYEEDPEKHLKHLEEIFPEDQWFARNPGILKGKSINDFTGNPIGFTLDGVEYIQHLIRGMYGHG